MRCRCFRPLAGQGCTEVKEVDGFSDFGVDFGNPDFVAYAMSYGAKGSRVGSVPRQGGAHKPRFAAVLWRLDLY
jgi:hypothetical protein